MSTYVVTFRIANLTARGHTYDERRERLVENVLAEGAGYWDETTSFFFVESNKDTYAMSEALVVGLSSKHDIVVVFDPQDMSACYFGPVQHEDVLLSFLPRARRQH